MIKLGKLQKNTVELDLKQHNKIQIKNDEGLKLSLHILNQLKKDKEIKIYSISFTDELKSVSCLRKVFSTPEEITSLKAIILGDIESRKLQGLPALTYTLAIDTMVVAFDQLKDLPVNFIVINTEDIEGFNTVFEARNDLKQGFYTYKDNTQTINGGI